MTTPKRVEDCVHDLWAVLASVAAFKAADKARYGCIDEAENFARVTERWLKRAGSRAVDRYYRRPSV